jgi:hypothetical protein
MNHLLIGHANKTETLLHHTEPPFLLIDDGPIADAFLNHFSAREFDFSTHSFNPVKNIDYLGARAFVSALYSAFPEGENTLTVRNGKRALLRLLLERPTRLDRLAPKHRKFDEATTEALAIINDVLLSPVLKPILCNPTNFSFKGSVVVKINRADIGDFDAFLLASLFIGQSGGQIIIPDFGFYGRDFYLSLIRQNRLTACVNFLEEVAPKLQRALLTMRDKYGAGCIWEDAQTLARY